MKGVPDPLSIFAVDLCDRGVPIGGGAANKVEDIRFLGNLNIARQPFLPVFVGSAELVVGLCDVLGHLLMGRHRARAILHGFHSQRLQGQLDFQIEIPLATHIAGAAQGICIEDFEEFWSPLKLPLGHGCTDPHLAKGAVGVKVVPYIAGASRAESHARHVGVLYPVAALALDAAAHIISEVVQIGYIECNRFFRCIEAIVCHHFLLRNRDFRGS